MLPTFWWTTFDVSGMFPPHWKADVRKTAVEADFRGFPRTPVISREAADVDRIPRGRVHADRVESDLPWLPKLYRSGFLDLAQRLAAAHPVWAARDERYGVVLNVQQGSEMRFECHVDSNSLTALLFFTDHGPGAGGELVIANDSEATSMTAIDRSCSVLRPQAGHLIFFDGRRNPHYVRPLMSDADIRIVAVMNYYTDLGPESARPPELNRHLYGDQLCHRRHHTGGRDAGASQDRVAVVADGGRPVATPRARSRRVIWRASPPGRAWQGWTSPWARSWTSALQRSRPFFSRAWWPMPTASKPSASARSRTAARQRCDELTLA